MKSGVEVGDNVWVKVGVWEGVEMNVGVGDVANKDVGAGLGGITVSGGKTNCSVTSCVAISSRAAGGEPQAARHTAMEATIEYQAILFIT